MAAVSPRPGPPRRLRTAGHALAVCLFSVAALLAGCAASGSTGPKGTVEVFLYGAGGPAPGGTYPYPGTVKFVGSSLVVEIAVGKSGHFTTELPAGTYQVTGRSPSFNGGRGVCDGGRLSVLAGRTMIVHVVCPIS